MATVLALPLLYERVAALLADEGPEVALSFGWREASKQTNQGPGRASRVVFEPGVDLAVGSYAGPKHPGQNPRPIATLLEQATVYVWACDSAKANDELAQYTAARLLHDAIVRAIHVSAMCDEVEERIPYSLGKPEWIRENRERVFGAEIRFTLTVEAMIPDSPWPEAPGGSATGEVGVKAVFPSGDEDPNPGPVTS